MMKTTSKARAVFVAASIACAAAQGGFGEIATDFETPPLGVVLPSICIGDFVVPKTMYTIEPAPVGAVNVTIKSRPLDLIEPGYDADTGLLFLKFVLPISDDAERAGVIIQFPADQLVSVNTCCSQKVQIKSGFTNFQSLTASTSAEVSAAFATQQASDMAIGSFSNATVSVSVTNGEKASKVDVTAEGGAMVNIDGDITTLSCTEESTCVVGGKIADRPASEAKKSSTMTTARCADVIVADDSVCVTSKVNVTVKTNQRLAINGIKQPCVQGGDLAGNGAPVGPVTPAPTVSTAPTMTMSPTAKPNTPPSQAPVTPPGTAGQPSSAVTVSIFSSAVAIGGAVLFFLLG